MDGIWRGHDIVVDEFASSQQKREEVVVVDSPYSVASGRLQVVLYLHLSHEVDVLVEHLPHHLLEFVGRVVPQPIQSPTEEHEGQFMTRPIVDPSIVAERLYDVAV